MLTVDLSGILKEELHDIGNPSEWIIGNTRITNIISMFREEEMVSIRITGETR